jgi:anti-anti-sigma factor
MHVTFNVGEQYPQISGKQADEFATELIRLEDSDFEDVILDFKGTEYINSMAMGSIFATYQKLQEEGRHLKLVNVNDKIRRLLRVANLTSLIGEDGEQPSGAQ